MKLRKAFAAVLQMMRIRRGLTQRELAVGVTQPHISQLEAFKTSPSLETAQELAHRLGLTPLALLALAHAAEEQVPPRTLLEQALGQLEALELADELLPGAPAPQQHPIQESAERAWRDVQTLKAEGKTQVEIIKLLGLPRSTVGRLWHKER